MRALKGIAGGLVGFAVMLLAIGIVTGLFVHELPEGNREVALVILGTVIGWAGAVVNYHYGSSEGSKRKTDMLATCPTGEAHDPVHVEEDLPGPQFGRDAA